MRIKIMSLMLLLSICGCDVLFRLADDAAGDASCLGQVCQPDRWLFVGIIGGATVSSEVSGGQFPEYDLDFASLEHFVRDASINPKDLTLATMTRDGVLRLSDFGVPSATAEAELDALAVGWSNAGDRLAVISATEDEGVFVLILGAGLDIQQRIAVDLGVTEDITREPSTYHYTVSWHPDDGQVAVASNSPRCAIITLADERVAVRDDLSSCYYVSSDVAIGEGRLSDAAVAGEAPSQVLRLVLADGQIVRTELLEPQPILVLNSHPSTGVLMTIEEGVLPQPAAAWRVGVRTLSAGPALFFDPTFAIRWLVPLDTAQPILEARGLLTDAGG